jgi:hypothetical protein
LGSSGAKGQRIAGKAIGPFGRQQIVAIDQTGQHRSAGDGERREDKAAEHRHDDHQLDQENEEILFFLRLLPAGAGLSELAGAIGP